MHFFFNFNLPELVAQYIKNQAGSVQSETSLLASFGKRGKKDTLRVFYVPNAEDWDPTEGYEDHIDITHPLLTHFPGLAPSLQAKADRLAQRDTPILEAEYTLEERVIEHGVREVNPNLSSQLIEHSPFISRAKTAIRKRTTMTTIGDLVQKTEEQLRCIPRFGEACIESVIEVLRSMDLQLATGDGEVSAQWVDIHDKLPEDIDTKNYQQMLSAAKAYQKESGAEVRLTQKTTEIASGIGHSGHQLLEPELRAKLEKLVLVQTQSLTPTACWEWMTKMWMQGFIGIKNMTDEQFCAELVDVFGLRGKGKPKIKEILVKGIAWSDVLTEEEVDLVAGFMGGVR